jgi:putative ATP-binding cassette transporter
MVEQANKARRTTLEAPRARSGLGSQAKVVLDAFHAAPERVGLLWLGVGLVVVIGATAYGQIQLNAWNKPFYDALSRKDLAGFGLQLVVFVRIAGALLMLNVAQTWLNQMMKLKLRAGLTRDLFAQWLTPNRAFLLAGAGEIGVNPDQRIHEDAHHLTELSTDLGVGLFQATLLLASFIGVLWILSEGVVFQLHESSFIIPGYMVWSALFYAGVASAASWRVGRPLIDLNAQHYARESDLRIALVHVNEHCDGIAANRGETGEKERLRYELDSLVVVLRRLVSATTKLTWVTAGYGWFTIVAPIVVAAPAYFLGNLTFGGLLMAVGAFTQVQQSLRWFVDNAATIADWRATLFRVGGFRLALIEMDRLGEGAGRIELVTTTDDRFRMDDVSVISPTGAITLNEAHVEIGPRERVLIVGSSKAGKTSLFRAIAGLWPWGGGRIGLPSDGVMFMPKRPYIPNRALRDILSYPDSPQRFTDQELNAALSRMGLSDLTPALDRVVRWDRNLTEAEQQAVAFARVLLHKPRWLFVDEAIESLGPESRKVLFDVFEKELATTTLVYIAGRQPDGGLFTRVLRLTKNPLGQRLTTTMPPSSSSSMGQAAPPDQRQERSSGP